MAENNNEVAKVAINDIGTEEDFIKAVDSTIKNFGDGDLVEGTVVKVDHDEVLLDIGYKTEGVIPSRELSIKKDVDPDEVVEVGDTIEALVVTKEDKEGRLILSKKRAQYERAWGDIEKIKEADGVVEGTVIEAVKGGLIVDIGLRGFLPASLVEMRRVRDLSPYIGQTIKAKILELDKNRNNVVLSRRQYLEETQSEVRETLTTSDGWSMCFQDSSETWIRPSTPPRSTNAPKLTMEDTTPSRIWPFLSWDRKVSRTSDWVSSRYWRRESTTLLRFLSSSRILALMVWPMYGDRSRTRRISTRDAGRKPRRPMSTMRPPLTASITVPSTTPSASLIFSMSPQARSYCARSLGQNQTAFLVFLGDDKSLNSVADLDDFVRINVLLDGKLTGGNDALSLVADVEQDLVVIDLDDGTFDQITITEVLDGGIDCLDEVLFGADVVDGDLGDFVIVLCH